MTVCDKSGNLGKRAEENYVYFQIFTFCKIVANENFSCFKKKVHVIYGTDVNFLFGMYFDLKDKKYGS